MGFFFLCFFLFFCSVYGFAIKDFSPPPCLRAAARGIPFPPSRSAKTSGLMRKAVSATDIFVWFFLYTPWLSSLSGKPGSIPISMLSRSALPSGIDTARAGQPGGRARSPGSFCLPPACGGDVFVSSNRPGMREEVRFSPSPHPDSALQRAASSKSRGGHAGGVPHPPHKASFSTRRFLSAPIPPISFSYSLWGKKRSRLGTGGCVLCSPCPPRSAPLFQIRAWSVPCVRRTTRWPSRCGSYPATTSSTATASCPG